MLYLSSDNHHMGRSHRRSQTTVPLPFRYGQASLSSGPFSRWTRVREYLLCRCSPQLQLWMWTGRVTTHLPLVAQTCVFMSVNWDRTDPSRHSRDTQSVFHFSSSSRCIAVGFFFKGQNYNEFNLSRCTSFKVSGLQNLVSSRKFKPKDNIQIKCLRACLGSLRTPLRTGF